MALADGFIFQVSPDGQLIDIANGTQSLRAFDTSDAAPDGTQTDRLFLFARPQRSDADQPLAQVAAAAVTPRAVRATPEILHAIETTALRYGSHDALRQAGLSVTDWTLFCQPSPNCPGLTETAVRDLVKSLSGFPEIRSAGEDRIGDPP